MYTYETIFITIPTLSEDEEKSLVAGFAQIVTDGGAAWAANERMGRRRLAYPIRKFDDGVYTRFLYDSDPAVPKELERRIRISDKVIRYLTVRMESDWAVASKEQAVRDAQARADAEAAAAAMPPAETLKVPVDDDEDDSEERGDDRDDDDRGRRSWAETAPRDGRDR